MAFDDMKHKSHRVARRRNDLDTYEVSLKLITCLQWNQEAAVNTEEQLTE